MDHDATSRHVVLVGEMGVGKTTLGAGLATRLGRAFHDSDDVIEANQGRTGAEIAAELGVPALHVIELRAFVDMMSHSSPCVIAAAASVVDTEPGRRLLQECYLVWLVTDEQALQARRKPGDHRRVVSGEERTAIAGRRRPWLIQLADVVIDTTTSDPGELAALLAAQVEGDV